jgi:arginine utilization regulatory protein
MPPYLQERLFERLNPVKEERSVNIDIPILSVAVEKMEKELITKALIRFDGNKTKAAKLLGLPRQTLTYKIKQLNIKE